MTDKLEEVARAIAQADEQNGGPPYEMRAQNKHSREMLFDEAKAAIGAYRVPTDGMVQAAIEAIDNYYTGSKDAPFEDSVKVALQAAADAALEGE